MYTWSVTPEESGLKLQMFLKTKLGDAYTMRSLKRAIENNLCTVNGRKERFAGTILGRGDKISFEPDQTQTSFPMPKSIESHRILYEDQDLLVYNKPPRIPSEGHLSIASLMKGYCPSSILVHRLDRDTTGALLFAKSQVIYNAFCMQFRSYQVSKVYVALVDGVPKQKEGFIENYFEPLQVYQGQTLWGIKPTPEACKDGKGQYAYTKWLCEVKGKKASLIRCFPKTGRTHQLRVHLSSMGHPILGDFQYGRNFHCSYKAPRCLLHAIELSFSHPSSGSLLHITAPIPEDFVLASSNVL